MKPIVRSEPVDLDAARKIVSREERRALDRAEQLRAEAEELLKLVSDQAVDAEVKVRAEFEDQIRALREEMAEASRRATVAESELELLRAGRPAGSGGAEPRTRVVTLGREEDQLAATAATTAAQLRAQAEIELSRAKEEAVGILAAASREAGDLLFSAMTAIENDTSAARAARRQAEDDGRQAGEALNAVRRQLLAEMLGLRDAMDQTRASFTQFLESSSADPAPPDRAVGSW